MRTSSVCFVLFFFEVADVETLLRPAGRYVDPVFQHSPRHNVRFVRHLSKAISVRFVEDAVEHVGHFFVAKKAGAQRFIVDARASNRHFLRLPSGPLLTGEGLCHVEFQGAPQGAEKWSAGVFCSARGSRIRTWRAI